MKLKSREQQVVTMLRETYSGADTTGFNAFDFVHAFGSGRDSLMYSQLFWPEFVEFRGMIFLKSTVETQSDKIRIEQVLNRTGSCAQIERDFNLTEVAHLFGKRIAETDNAQDNLLATILCEMWSCRLKILFPKRDTRVEMVPPEDVDGTAALTFFSSQDE